MTKAATWTQNRWTSWLWVSGVPLALMLWAATTIPG